MNQKDDMKYPAFLIVSFVFLSTSSLAQEKYFHELRGFEDSTGTTHLFHRLFERVYFQCNEANGGHITTNDYNSVYHFDTEAKTDSIKFHDYVSEWCLHGMYSGGHVLDYDFIDDNLSKWIKSTRSIDWFVPSFVDYRDNILELPFPIIIKRNFEEPYNWPLGTFKLHPSYDSLYIEFQEGLAPFPGSPKEWPDFEYSYESMLEYLDSLFVPKTLLNIHPRIDSLFFFINPKGHLFRSEHRLQEYALADSSTHFGELKFDASDQYIYADIGNKKYQVFSHNLVISNNLGKEDSWEFVNLSHLIDKIIHLEVDQKIAGELYVAGSNTVLKSTDFGTIFNPYFTSISPIAGLYKKPGSDILYVLTRKELFEVENGSATSLKKLSVSNEETTELPTQISLHQNYPNPFNPVTTIRFELVKPAFTRLTVYDALGRKIRTLTEEIRPTGINSVSFDASDLASGIYLYRLEADGLLQTRKMTLIK